MNMFINFESNSATNLNEEIRTYCEEKKLVEVSRSAPTSFVLDSNAHIIVTSELRPMTEEEICNLEHEICNLELKKRLTDAGRDLKILEMTIEEMDVSVYLFNALKRAGINCLADILLTEPKAFLKMIGMGKKTYNELIEKLDSFGFDIREK